MMLNVYVLLSLIPVSVQGNSNSYSSEPVDNCTEPVGISDPDKIPDDQMTAYSQRASSSQPAYGRLNDDRGYGWCAAEPARNNDWLQVDLGTTYQVCGMATQGDTAGTKWVTDFKLSYSSNESAWTTYKNEDGVEVEFQRQGDSNQVDQHQLSVPVPARYFRFYPTNQHVWNCLRVELYGVKHEDCQVPSNTAESTTSAINSPSTLNTSVPIPTTTLPATQSLPTPKTATAETMGSSETSVHHSLVTSSALSTLTITQQEQPNSSATTPSTSSTPPTLSVITPSTSSKAPQSTASELTKEFIDTLENMDVANQHSVQVVADLFQNTTQQLKAYYLHESQQNITTEQKRNVLIFKMAFALEDFALKYGQYHLNESHRQLNNTYKNLVLRIERASSKNARDFLIQGPEKQNSINISSSNFHENGSVLLGIVYKDLHQLLTSNQTKSKRRLGTRIMAASMDPKPEKLLQNVALNFKTKKAANEETFCMFWNGYSKQTPDGWSGKGCNVMESKTSFEETTCSCSHFTHFAVLFDISDDVEITYTDEQALKIITYVGLALSITGIILTIICYVSFTDVHQPLSQVRISLSGSLGAAHIIFLAGINATENKGECVTVAALMLYFLLAAFCWMLVEAVYLYLLVVKVYNVNEKMTIYHVFAWGLPAVTVTIALVIAAGEDGIASFVNDNHCWLSTDNNLIWLYVGFVVLIEGMCGLLLMRVIKEMNSMHSAGETNREQIKLSIKTFVLLAPLLGLTWLFGLFTPLHVAFNYIFTILNASQGLLIFLLHCLRNREIRDRIKRRYNVIFPDISGPTAARTITVQAAPNSAS